MMPNINSATARVLDAAGIQTLVADGAGCCGAIRLHLGDHDGALDHMRSNIDAWWPMVQSGAVEAIVMNASGCGVTVKEYGHSLAHDPALRDEGGPHRRPDARPVRAAARPRRHAAPSPGPRPLARRAGERRPARFHPPCTLAARPALARRRRDRARARSASTCASRPTRRTSAAARPEPTRCCSPSSPTRCATASSANLDELAPTTIVSANIGCIQHLQSGTTTPVRHWVEVLDDALAH